MSVPPEIIDAARRWTRWASENHALARVTSANTDLVPRGACMWAHQSGEKAIKAVLVAYDIDPPKLHDLHRLTQRFPEAARTLLVSVDLASLSRWAIDALYPDDFEEATRAQAAEAVACAHEVLVIVTGHLDDLFGGAST